jgi:hypothetical protein
LAVDGIALQQADRLGIILANFTREIQPVRLECPGLSGRLSVRTLDDDTKHLATDSPTTFRSKDRDTVNAEGGRIELELSPHAVVYIETGRPLQG